MQEPGNPASVGPAGASSEEEGSSRQTYLASERTQLGSLTALLLVVD